MQRRAGRVRCAALKDYRRGAHTTFEIHPHLVWVTKSRKAVMTGEVGTRLREVIREICGNREVTIIKGHISKDHVPLSVRWGGSAHLGAIRLKAGRS